MRRWLPFPLLTACLVGMWLLLNDGLSVGGLLLGTILALVAVRACMKLTPPEGKFRRPGAALRLTWVVLGDIVRSNFAVARIILGQGARKQTSGFLRIPLDMRAPHGLAALACIITATPGTFWVSYDSASNTVLLHILDLVDEEAWLKTIKERYESRLMEIFE